ETDMAVIRPEDHSMIYCAMPYAIEGLLETEKTLKKDELVTDTGAELIRDTVVSVDFEEKQLRVQSGETYRWRRLVIATGAEPILPPIPGGELGGVTVFKSEKDMNRISARVEDGLKEAVVVGAGAIGVELAQALAAKKVKTRLVDMVDSVLPNLADPEMTDVAREQLEEEGIELHLGRKVEALEGSSEVEAAVLDNGESLAAGLVVFAVGMKPNIELFENSGLEMVKDGIVVNGEMRTNIEEVYAAGDCVSYYSGITGERTGGKLATNAVPMARVLADNLRGRPREYSGFFNGSATKAGDLYVGGTGLKEAEAKARFDTIVFYAEFTTAFPIMPTAKKVRLKMIADRETGRILGGQVVSGEPVTDKVDQITMAIQFGITAPQLLGFSYSSQPWQSFFPAHNLLVKAAEKIAAEMEPSRRSAVKIG
ncbi:MAG: FAD-dependent oxidoreductase, partial [Spirochaetia bacterium]